MNAPTATPRTWHYEDLSSWADTVMAPQVNATVVRRFRAKPPRYVVGDDLTWLNRLVETCCG